MTENFIIGTIALEVPVRRYRIEAVLREKPTLEAPAEACLKALSIAGRLTEGALVEYLGLSTGEFNVIASELLGQYLVRRSGPDLMLTDEGRKAIDPNAEGQKRTKISATLAFEEAAYAEAPLGQGRAMPWMKRMILNRNQDGHDGRPEAASAFREGFSAWKIRERERQKKKLDEGFHDSLARIVTVVPLGRDTTVIKSPVVLASASDAAFIDVSEITLGSISSPKRREICAERFQETVKVSVAPQDGGAALEWISKHVIPIPGNPEAYPVSWARHVRQGEFFVPEKTSLVAETVPSLIARGAQNDWLREATSKFQPAENYDDSDVILWSPPEGDTWRLDAKIDEAVASLQSDVALADNNSTGMVIALFRTRKGKKDEAEKIWNVRGTKGPFREILFSTTPPSDRSALSSGLGEDLPQALELVVRPRSWALAIAHLVTDRAPIPIPVGIATTDPSKVDALLSVLRERIRSSLKSDWCISGDHATATHRIGTVIEKLNCC